MEIFKTKEDLITHLSTIANDAKSVGFVPTMGALHQGHLSLVATANKNNAISVASIFVNPTQFDNPEDLKKYPNTLEKDITMLENAKCDVLFLPNITELYAENVVSQSFDFDGLEHEMEGKFRAGHFDGVGTIVKMLFEIVRPTNAYFGEKDFQQLQIIKKLTEKEKLGINIIGCPIFREEDGLAMSSRNMRLTEVQRTAAPLIFKTLQEVQALFKTESLEGISNYVTSSINAHPELKLEYFSIAFEDTLKTMTEKDSTQKSRAFIAVFAGSIRLIDNILLS